MSYVSRRSRHLKQKFFLLILKCNVMNYMGSYFLRCSRGFDTQFLVHLCSSLLFSRSFLSMSRKGVLGTNVLMNSIQYVRVFWLINTTTRDFEIVAETVVDSPKYFHLLLSTSSLSGLRDSFPREDFEFAESPFFFTFTKQWFL